MASSVRCATKTSTKRTGKRDTLHRTGGMCTPSAAVGAPWTRVHKDWGVTPVGSRRTQLYTTCGKAVDAALQMSREGWRSVITNKGVGRMLAEVHKIQGGVITYTPHPANRLPELAELQEVLDARGAVDATQSRSRPGA